MLTSHRRSPAVILLTCVLLVPASAVAPAPAGEGKIKQGFKDAGEGIKSLGKKAGEKGAEAGHAIAGVAKKVWYKGKQVSAPLLRGAQKATRKFWDKVIEGKDRSIDAVREENESLKEELDKGSD